MEIIELHDLQNGPPDVTVGFSQIDNGLKPSGLSIQEHKEFTGFKSEKRKAEFLSVRRLFLYVIEKRGIDVSKVQLKKENSGKPFAQIENDLLHVSFSHTDKFVFCAVSSNYEIGLDAEPLDRKINDKVLKRILNEEEKQNLTGISPVQLWTIKEAVVKCMGTGLRTNLNDLTIKKGKKNRFSVRFNDDICYEICSFQQSNHQIALAYQSQNC